MFTSTTPRIQRTAGTMAAIFVVAFAGLMFEHGHHGALPQGVVEVGELTPINLEQLAMVTLPEVEVVGSREQAVAFVLPEVVVVGTREQLLAGEPAAARQDPRG